MKTPYKILNIIIITLLTACSDDIAESVKQCNVDITINMPTDMPQGELTDEIYHISNISSGVAYSQKNSKIDLIPGIYDINYEANFKSNDGRLFRLRAFNQSCIINEANTKLELNANYIIDSDDLIIYEIFFTGTLQSSGNSYNGDDYVKLYNNTDHIVYADGLTLFESKFSTTEKQNFTPDIMNQAMTVQALYTIPGSGTDYPVNPGEYLLLADTGIDHRIANPYSFDLSNADFEWYDISSSPSNLDIDGPNVTNLDKWYCYTRSYWMLHNRGFKAFGIARIPISKDEYLRDYYYSYDYEVVTAVGSFPMTGEAYKIPNDMIVDVVNCSVESDYAWNVCDPTLDCGWTSCGNISNDKNRFFKSVRRKLLYINESGIPVFKDTNNSSVDFNSSVIPSEIEKQGTAIDMYGNKATTLTYDGITPLEK